MPMMSDATEVSPSSEFKVLIADDTAANRAMLQVFLRKLGYAAVMANDGHEAVEAYCREQPDLVLMDVMMPVMDGFEATRQIRALQASDWVPVVMLSALSSEADIAAGLDAGADDYLVKPISFSVFSAKMRSLQRQLLMQRAITESLGQLRAISDAVIDGIITIDARGIIQSCNRAACRTFGYSPAELIGQNVSMLMPESDRSKHDGFLARYLAGDAPYVVGSTRQVQALRRSGEVFPVELGVTDIELPQRHIFVGVVRDVTERERVARERAQTQASLAMLYSEQEHEQELARSIMERQVHGHWLEDARVQYAVAPTKRFSGDLVMVARSPSGRTFAMLADATGHGLVAAISVLPILSLFYTEVARDPGVAGLASAINDQLLAALPVGRFVGAALLCLSADARQGEIWVGGVPEGLLLDADGRVARRFASEHLPLGIVPSDPDLLRTISFEVAPGQQLLLYSDGLIEAGAGGEAFGIERLEQVLRGAAPTARIEALQGALFAHLGGEPSHDDVSMLLLSCEPYREAASR